MTQPDWDDDRVAAAFHARFDRPAPPTLGRAIHGAIAGTSPARRGLFRSGPGLGIAAAVVVTVLIGTVVVGIGPLGRLGGAPLASGSSAAPTAAATPTEQALPGSVLDLPIITVSDALAIRDAGVDDRELAVMGWFTPAPPLTCQAPEEHPVSPVQLRCEDPSIWLTERAESLVHRTATSLESTEPTSPALNPDLDDLDTSWQPEDLGIAANGESAPTDVVFIGHFDDRRALLCPAAEQAACRDRFVVDAVAFVAGRLQPRSLVQVGGLQPASSAAEIEAVLAAEAPQSPILSMVVADGPTELAAIEPSLGTGEQGLIDQRFLWIARVLETDRISTYVIVDGTDAIYEMTEGGDAVQVGGATGGAVVSPRPWPPDDAVVVALTSPVGAGEPPVQVAVIDQSGRLVSVSEKGAVDPSTQSFDGRFGAYAEPGSPGRVHLAWVGGICDSHITVTVTADLGSITFDMGPPPANCDSLGVGRELVLDFDGSVDVPAIALIDVADGPVPVATSPAYQLDCGPLGPDTCEQKAAAIVAAHLRASPSKRIVSITFEGTERCLSHTVFFDDGTGAGAEPACIAPASPR